MLDLDQFEERSVQILSTREKADGYHSWLPKLEQAFSELTDEQKVYAERAIGRWLTIGSHEVKTIALSLIEIYRMSSLAPDVAVICDLPASTRVDLELRLRAQSVLDQLNG